MPTSLSGSLDTLSLADLLQWLEVNGLSGRLTLHLGDLRRTIDLKAGAIVFVSSSLPEERLGHFLVDRGLVSLPVAYELLAESFVTGRNLTRLVLDHGLLLHERLASAVETLAMNLLLDVFHWSGATFAFDPLVPTEDVLRIHLSLRGQAVAIRGAKSVDDSARVRLELRAADAGVEAYVRAFERAALEETFFRLLVECGGDGLSADALHRRFHAFLDYAGRVRERLAAPAGVFPVFDDTAALAEAALAAGEGPEPLVQVAALDPFLTANLLFLANALRTPRKGLVSTAREAAEAIGSGALTKLVSLVTHAPKTASADKLERAVRRTALSTGVAASHVASRLDIDAEAAYTLGLLEPLGGYEPLKLLREADFEPGPFRAAVLGEFRSLAGHALAKKLNLPRPFGDVLGSTGRVDDSSPDAERLIFLARQLVPQGPIGREFTSDDPALADRFASLTADEALSSKVTDDVARIRELVGL